MFTFGSRVRKLREAMGFSQDELCELINQLDGELPNNISCSIDRNRLGRLERDQLEPNLSEIVTLSHVLEISVQCLTLNDCRIDIDGTVTSEIERLCEGMSETRRQLFLYYVRHNAELTQKFDHLP